nr:unnamed protein product [Callosobruchus chinensis]
MAEMWDMTLAVIPSSQRYGGKRDEWGVATPPSPIGIDSDVDYANLAPAPTLSERRAKIRSLNHLEPIQPSNNKVIGKEHTSKVKEAAYITSSNKVPTHQTKRESQTDMTPSHQHHTARITQQYVNNVDIDVLEMPALSPEANLIEHV